jgi:hypothetical protein
MKGDGVVKQVSLKNTKSAKIAMLEMAGVFGAIDSKVNSQDFYL